jgi:deazaflavin-dependent oxidoreductase (nitroreductase family)
MGTTANREPFAARLHFIPRLIVRPIQTAIVRAFHAYFARAPGWMLLTTRGRRTGLPREVLLPCVRTADLIMTMSTYGMRSDWIRNLRKDPAVQVTSGGQVVPARAEIITDLARKHALVTAHPFFAPAPFAIVNAVVLALFRPLLVGFLRRWVTVRPVVVLHFTGNSGAPPNLEGT